MAESEGLSKDEKLALVTKIMGHLELAGAKDSDGLDVIMIIAHLLIPGRSIDLRICNPVRDF